MSTNLADDYATGIAPFDHEAVLAAVDDFDRWHNVDGFMAYATFHRGGDFTIEVVRNDVVVGTAHNSLDRFEELVMEIEQEKMEVAA